MELKQGLEAEGAAGRRTGSERVAKEARGNPRKCSVTAANAGLFPGGRKQALSPLRVGVF